MFKFIIRRILITFPVVLGVCTLTFSLVHFVPGDPVDIMLGDQASAFDKESLRQQLGLNEPLLKQYKNFLIGLVQLDLGNSLHAKTSVITTLAERIPATVELTIAAMFLAIFFGKKNNLLFL